MPERYNARSMIQHTWCSFCEDRPAIGRMVIMRDRSRDQISEIRGEDGAACDLHGRAWTGTPVAANEDTGGYAVLQYVHPDYIKVTEQHIADFACEKTCSECGDPAEPLPLWAVDRILMAHPYLVLDTDEFRWEGICQECASRHACPHCGDKSEEDEDGNNPSPHPYCH